MQLISTMLEWLTKIIDFIKWAWRLLAGPRKRTED